MAVQKAMVWKDNFLVDGDPTTFEGFCDDFFLFCYFRDPKDIFSLNLHEYAHVGDKPFPKHFFFANFQCLRCGLCCKNYEAVEIYPEQVEKWELEGREDILKHIWTLRDNSGRIVIAEVFSRSWRGCPLCRKITGKPYYYCRIQSAKKNIPVCKAYLCSKSLPVAHLNYKDVDELIELIGVDGYYALIERDWGEEFDYSACGLKTHKKLTGP